MVGETTVPLYYKPHWYGESYFDQMGSYSLNVQVRPVRICGDTPPMLKTLAQVISLPNLRIVDFAYSHTGSTHDATVCEETRIAQQLG